MNIDTSTLTSGKIKLEQLINGEWTVICEKNNTVNVGLKYALASMISTGASIVANKMSAGTAVSTFTENSVALGNEVSSTVDLVNTASQKVSTSVGTILFAGSYTIKEVGLWYNTTPLAFTTVQDTAVTSLSPIRISWSITIS